MAKFLTFDDWLIKRLAHDTEEAAEWLRVATELFAMLSLMSQQPMELAQAV